MIHIKLQDRRAPFDLPDPMDRSWIGYDPTVPVDELFEVNRGTWVMGPRANGERYAAFSYAGEIKFVAEIDRVQPAKLGGRKVIVGRVLDVEHPVAQRVVGSMAPDTSRNPVTYHEGPDATPSCSCGCGDQAPPGRAFLPGHDQKAIHARIAQQWGDTLGFIHWFDQTYPEAT